MVLSSPRFRVLNQNNPGNYTIKLKKPQSRINQNIFKLDQMQASSNFCTTINLVVTSLNDLKYFVPNNEPYPFKSYFMDNEKTHFNLLETDFKGEHVIT